MSRLKTTFCGLEMKNPLVLGAGPLTGTVEGVKRCVDAGYGAVITKTASMFDYYHKFPITRYNLVNYEKSNRGLNFRDWVWFHNDHNSPLFPIEFTHVIKESADYCRKNNCLLIGSFAGSNLETWAENAKAYEEAGADIIELNMCCPGPATLMDIRKDGDMTMLYGDVLGRNIDLAVEVVKAVAAVVKVPIVCKMPPQNRLSIKENVKKLVDAGAKGVECYANAKGMRVDIESAAPIGSGTTTINAHGYLADAMYDVSQVMREGIDVDIIAGRGVRYWSDAVELLMAGAQTAEMCTIAFVYGVDIVKEFLREMENFLERKGYDSIDDIRGKALKKQLKPSEIKDKVKPVFAKVEPKRCKACGRCQEVCAYMAPTVYYKEGAGMAKIEKSHCVGCTLCAQVCPYDAIELEERTVEEYLDALYIEHPGYSWK